MSTTSQDGPQRPSSPPRARPRRVPASAGAFVAVVTGVLAVSLAVSGAVPGLPGAAPAAAAGLEPFGSCEDLAAHYRDAARAEVTAFGLEQPAASRMSAGAVGAASEASADAAAGPAVASAPGSRSSVPSGTSATGTNVQVTGVDEPDVAKTDGQRLVVLRGDELVVADVSGPEPREVGRVGLGAAGGPGGPAGTSRSWPGPPPGGTPGGLLLVGDRAVVLTPTSSVPRGAGPQPGGAAGAPVPVVQGVDRTVVTAVDLAGEPRVVSSLEVDGSLVDGRLAGGVVRLAVASRPVGLALVQPGSGSVAAEQEAREANLAVVAGAEAEDFLPSAARRDADGSVVQAGPLMGCEDVSRPQEPSGSSTLSLLTLDPAAADPLAEVSPRALVADGATLYATAGRTVVATSASATSFWGPTTPEPGSRTELHVFGTAGSGPARHLVSGEVDGVVQDRWGLSVDGDRLRVVTTVLRGRDAQDRQPSGGASSDDVLVPGPVPGPGGPATSSSLVVLRLPADDATGDSSLVETGRVDDLGRDEDVYAVRYVGDRAYVVTFRQVDPLHVVDLSDPDAPRLAGELKVPGYSAYLHPVGEGRLLGVGADGRGRAEASLFDVADADDPRRLDVTAVGEGQALVEQDSRAFAWLPDDGGQDGGGQDGGDGAAVLPFASWDDGSAQVRLLRVSGEGVGAGATARLPGPSQTLRALPLRDQVVAVTADALRVLDPADGLAERAALDLG